jgi:hypothetical protein
MPIENEKEEEKILIPEAGILIPEEGILSSNEEEEKLIPETKPEEYKLVRVANDDPNRCQTVTGRGQCVNRVVEGGKNCLAHGGNVHTAKIIKKAYNMYQVERFQARISRFAESENVKSLTSELAILRMLLEERLIVCKDDHDLLLASAQISDLIIKIEKIVKSCHHLESSMGQLLDRTDIINFSTRVVDLISNVLQNDEEKINKIANGIIKILGSIGDGSCPT